MILIDLIWLCSDASSSLACPLGYNKFDFFYKIKNTDPLMGAKCKSKTHLLIGTVSWDRFQKFWLKFKELGLTKGRGWFLNFLGAPMILKCKKCIYCD